MSSPARRSSLLLLLLILYQQIGRSFASKVQWTTCQPGEFTTNITIQCATLQVPLDYSSSSDKNDNNTNKMIDLHLVRIPALVQPSKGSIQLNFGGPGEPTRETAVALGPLLQVGTGTTIPFVCTKDAFTVGQILDEVGRSSLESDTAERRLWERARVDADICAQSGNGNETGPYIGTAYVARDMMRVAEALDEDGMLRYWGFSYGTTLGATLAAMFPDRIDRMVIDGVQNPHEYYHAQADFEEWTDSDAVFSYFFSSCLTAAPGRCALATLNKTAAQLEKDTWEFIESLRQAPIPAGSILIDMGAFKNFIIGELKFAGGWPDLSALLSVLVYGTPQEKVRVLEAIVDEASKTQQLGPSSFDVVASLWGIHCGDRTVRLGSFEAQQKDGVFSRLYKTSRLVGDVVTQITAHCAQWPWHARETYSGDFRIRTKNPILVASNLRDSHTPLKSALNVSAGFEGSGLLQVNGTGHATLNVPSVCGFLATVAYWVNGTLPKLGQVCQAPHPFDPYTWADVLTQVTGTNTTTSQKRALHPRWWR
ncbi:hypothetical protein QBC47DRAFT_436436 [Echria macrotheca]|uniref:TAP-like protein-domain-containing protein n=1 Tax=Echria macrotheca TaxID=438768 RepID=A0AAJ0BKW2_9PEZI|nr:hypothetical protein QBC47DRAFT_436436 [Echria macrotheca]